MKIKLKNGEVVDFTEEDIDFLLDNSELSRKSRSCDLSTAEKRKCNTIRNRLLRAGLIKITQKAVIFKGYYQAPRWQWTKYGKKVCAELENLNEIERLKEELKEISDALLERSVEASNRKYVE